MSANPLSVEQVRRVEEMLTLNKEVVGFHNQLTQHKNALNMIRDLRKRIKNKQVTRVNMPHVGNISIPISAKDKTFQADLNNKEKQLDTAVRGIVGQIQHRTDYFNETTMKVFRTLGNYLIKNQLPLPSFEEKIKEEKK